MKENGIEIVQIPIEQHNLYMEKRIKSNESQKERERSRSRDFDNNDYD